MSSTLGEKLRLAREERGISIMEVSEQTRISPLYLEAIENDDYSPLPGGIFNKGFVKSFAKYVGVDENEALQDYARLITQQTGSEDSMEPQTYRPEVLTDDRASSSNLLTIVFAVVILGLMTWGILALVGYIQDQQNQPLAANSNTTNVNSNVSESNANTAVNTTEQIPATNEIKLQSKALSDRINVTYWIDGKMFSKDVSTESPLDITAKDSLKIAYYRGFTADKIQLTINGKPITAPDPPVKGNTNVFEINKTNIVQILQSGKISVEAENTNTNANRAR